MLFDIRKIHAKSLGEFAREYVMIVVGILTALGLEHVVSNHEHAKSAAESRERIVAELRSDLVDLGASRAENARQLKPLVSLSAEIKQAVKAGETPEKLAELIAERSGQLQMAFSVPGFRHEAWDVAVANQSATYIDPEALRRFSAAYAIERDVLSVNGAAGATALNGSRLLDALLDVELHRTDPVELLKALGQTIATLNSMIGSMTQAQQEIEAALARASKDDPIAHHRRRPEENGAVTGHEWVEERGDHPARHAV